MVAVWSALDDRPNGFGCRLEYLERVWLKPIVWSAFALVLGLTILGLAALAEAQTPVPPDEADWTQVLFASSDSEVRDSDSGPTAVGWVYVTPGTGLWDIVVGTHGAWNTHQVDAFNGACIANAGGSNWVVAYSNDTDPDDSVFESITSTDDGATWGSPVTIDDLGVSTERCDLVFAGSKLNLVVREAGGTPNYYSSANQGSSWSESANHFDTLAPSFASWQQGVGVADSSVIYLEYLAGGTTRLGRWETLDNGNTWTFDSVVTSVTNDRIDALDADTVLFNRNDGAGGEEIVAGRTNNGGDSYTLTVLAQDDSFTKTSVNGFGFDAGSYYVAFYGRGTGSTVNASFSTDGVSWLDGVVDSSFAALGGAVGLTGGTLYGFTGDDADGDKPTYFFVDASDIVPPIPTAPAGLSAFVQRVCDGTAPIVGGTSQILLRWPISSNDTNQTSGSFTYKIYHDLSVTTDPLTSVDTGGFREATLSIDGVGCGDSDVAIKIRASNAGGDEGPASCIVTVNPGTLNDNESCGNVSGFGPVGAGSGDIFDLTGIADGIGLSIEAVGWLIGVFITVGLVGALGFKFGLIGATGGLALGIGTATVFGWFPLWFIVFVLVLAAGVFVLRRGAD